MNTTRVFFNKDEKLRSGWRVLIFICVLSVFGIISTVILQTAGIKMKIDNVANPFGQLVTGFFVLLSVIISVLIMLKYFEKRDLSTLGLHFSSKVVKGLVIGLSAGAVPIILSFLFFVIFADAKINFGNFETEYFLINFLMIGAGLIFISAWEEIVLRGYLLQIISEGAGVWVSIVLTSLVFGFAHSGNEGANILGVFNTTVNAVLLALIVVKSGSLLFAIGYHCAWNLTSALILGFKVSGNEFPVSLLQTNIIGADWLTGGSYGFEGSVFVGILELLALLIFLGFVKYIPPDEKARKYFNWK